MSITKKKQTHRYIENKLVITSGEREVGRDKTGVGVFFFNFIKKYKLLSIK